MDGSPLVRLGVVLVFLIVLGIPVVALTREKPAEAPAAPVVAKAPAEELTVDLAVTLTQPGTVEIRVADQVVASSDAPVATLEKSLTLPGGGAELSVLFRWADAGVNHAGRVVVSHDGDDLADQTLWGEAEAQDVVRVKAPAQP